MADSTAPTCQLADCEKPRFQRGWCQRHYKRWWRYGSPTAGGSQRDAKTNPVCLVEWCDRPTKAKGLCPACYWYARAHGLDPADRRPFGRKEVEDILAVVAEIPQDTDGCRDARGHLSTTDEGYARIKMGETRVTVTRLVLADKLRRPVPDDLVACHTCDHPWCVERTHLWEGTHQDNFRDRDAKGRNAYGSRNASSSLTEEQVRAIRREHRPWRSARDQGNRAELARRYGVGPSTISKIIARVSWTHVE